MRPKVLQIVGYKNSGKTALVCRLISELSRFDLRVGTIKHDGAHDFTLDHPGTDTWKHSQAGAHTIAITSRQKTAWIRRQPTTLEMLIAAMSDMDIVLVEGFKREPYPKVVLLKNEAELELIHQVSNIVAILSRFSPPSLPYPVWTTQQVEGLLEFLLKTMGVDHNEKLCGDS
ncbi:MULTISPECIES: molybdopterin-guanine dinucleotide biosynthesis protein B [unclassified Thermoactinomyces]|uniref:molybdopterin-guanine dinucleotide biosynthesis protein B n=1 Tax=unclassified Thermoactinomyces TaxID=2634588 RepID=UPI0018DD2479|nr:molybdopterin-guanine dinucleotide biosynthesis protein B [Thermoactinomyces sp. CICC 10523]MBH8605731.1 molybdopterin-guanine dinucleotide biosynthesis protein B [Thermoactinomyces sp. CICC 10522]MBH8609199.1 molybdopterin-guanine dinucleotide biosynthesis protein B [Thermoactinomyces sp. CICC 10521]